MKRIIFILLIIFMSANIVYADNPTNEKEVPKVYLNEELLLTDNIPFYNDGVLYLPLKEIKEKYNIYVSWSSEYKGIVMNDFLNDKIVYLKANINVSKYQTYKSVKHGKYELIDEIQLATEKEEMLKFTKPYIDRGGVAYISYKFLNEVLGFQVSIGENTKEIHINREISDIDIREHLKRLFDIFYINNYINKDNSFYKDDRKRNHEKYRNEFIDRVINPNNKQNYYHFRDIDELDVFMGIVGNTYWIKKDLSSNTRSIDNPENCIKLETTDYYCKMKIEDVRCHKVVDSYSLHSELDGYIYMDYVCIIDNKKYLIPTITIITAKVEDYEIFDKDPKTIFKWNKKTWDNVNKFDYWVGMAKDMAIMTMGRPDDINRTVGSWGTYEQWVYRSSNFNNAYLYFENGTLKSWQD